MENKRKKAPCSYRGLDGVHFGEKDCPTEEKMSVVCCSECGYIFRTKNKSIENSGEFFQKKE